MWLFIALALALQPTTAAFAQTPSPLQEWQYPGGIILQRLFEPEVPKWNRIGVVTASVQPLYEGSDVYHGEGGPAINIRYRDVAFASFGEGLGVNLIRARHVGLGVSLGYDRGRRVSTDYAHLHGLGDIQWAVVPKWFAAWAISKRFPLVLRVDARRAIRAADGFVGDIEAYLPLPGSSRRFIVFAGPTYTFADQHHLQELFGVTALQAKNSGYGVFTPHGGWQAKGLGFSATLFITKHWLLNLDGAVSELVGSAGESPMTRRRTQRTLDVAVGYKW